MKQRFPAGIKLGTLLLCGMRLNHTVHAQINVDFK